MLNLNNVVTKANTYLQVAAFRATLEEISESSLLVHVVDIRYNLRNPVKETYF